MSIDGDDTRVVRLPSGCAIYIYQRDGAFWATSTRLRLRAERLLASNPDVAVLEALHLVAEALDELLADRAEVERLLTPTCALAAALTTTPKETP